MIYVLTIKNPRGLPLTHSGSLCIEYVYTFRADTVNTARHAVNHQLQDLHSTDKSIWNWADSAGTDLWNHDFKSDYLNKHLDMEISCKEQA